MKNTITQLVTFLAVFIIGASCGSITIFHCIPTSPAIDSNGVSFANASRSEKIALAKRWLHLPSNAPAGLLWHTYMSRRYGVTIDASLKEMQKGQVARDWKYNLRSEGLPEWCPTTVIYIKQNFEINIMQKFITELIVGCSPFSSRDELLAKLAQTHNEFEIAAKNTQGKLEFEDWYAAKIIHAFGLPKDTSRTQAWQFYTRMIRCLGGVSSEQEMKEFDHHTRREEALLVTQLPADTDDSRLFCQLSNIIEAIHLESPDAPLSWKFFY